MKHSKNMSLTECEVKVMDLIFDGLTNLEIAKALSITEKTVKFHITNIYRKKEIKCRAKLIVEHYKNELAKLLAGA